jgi:hypothetical protein
LAAVDSNSKAAAAIKIFFMLAPFVVVHGRDGHTPKSHTHAKV